VQADFLTVYISEAHASDEWALPDAEGAGELIPSGIVQPRSLDARAALARCFASRFPGVGRLVVDSIDNSANRAYAAWPERLYIIVDGVVVFKSGPGPFGYVLDDVRKWLEQFKLGNSGKE
jgi:type I thyroxine 5'-deiodinase